MPQPGPGEILVKVAAAGVNRPGRAAAHGRLIRRRPARRDIPGPRDRRRGRRARRGRDALEIGRQGRWRWWPAAAMPSTASAHESHAMPVPAGLRLVEAGASAETFFTVWHNVFERGRLEGRRDACWCTAARPASAPPPSSSPRRSARRCSSPPARQTKCEACRKLGADRGHQLQDRGLRRQRPRPRPTAQAPNVILDMVGGDYIDRNYEAAAVEGRIVQIALPRRAEGDASTFAGSC